MTSPRRSLRAMGDDFSASFITRHGCDSMPVKMHFLSLRSLPARRLLRGMAGRSASFITRHGQEVAGWSWQTLAAGYWCGWLAGWLTGWLAGGRWLTGESDCVSRVGKGFTAFI